MDYRDLLNEVKKYESRFTSNFPTERLYDNCISPNYFNWKSLEESDTKKIFEFLNKWGRCRMKSRPLDLLIEYRKIATFSNELRNLRLEEVDLDQIITVGNESLTLKRVIHLVFDAISNIQGFGAVPASKTLHLVSPSLIVMWDNAICLDLYHLKLNGYSYAYKFMPKMKEELEGAINTCMEKEGLARAQAIKWLLDEIENICGTQRSLVKAIDEYNWSKAPR